MRSVSSYIVRARRHTRRDGDKKRNPLLANHVLLGLLALLAARVDVHVTRTIHSESLCVEERKEELDDALAAGVERREDLGVALCAAPEKRKDILDPVPVQPASLVVAVVEDVGGLALEGRRGEGGDVRCWSRLQHGGQERDEEGKVHGEEREEQSLVVHLREDRSGRGHGKVALHPLS